MTLTAVVLFSVRMSCARLIFASFVWRIAGVEKLVMKSAALTFLSALKTFIQGKCIFLHQRSKLTTNVVENLPSSNTSLSIVVIKANAKQ